VDDKRLENIENMLTDLIRIVGNTNAMLEEIRDKLKGLTVKVDGLENRFDGLEKRMGGPEGRIDNLGRKVDVIQRDVEIIKSAMATKEDIRLMNERQDFQMEKLGRQEEDIYRLKRLVGVK